MDFLNLVGDEIKNPFMTVKIIGHQWYWTYEYGDAAETLQEVVNFDSYMLPESELTVEKPYRLLEVDNRIVLPLFLQIRLLFTSADVLHSWAVPSLGIKMDACPGRLNQVGLFINRVGIFYGQCSEICGVNHSFMPIVVLGKRFLN